jgi:hypothetical protein
LVRIDGHTPEPLHRLAGDETAQTGYCYGMAQDVSRSRESLISQKQAVWNALARAKNLHTGVENRPRNSDNKRFAKKSAVSLRDGSTDPSVMI